MSIETQQPLEPVPVYVPPSLPMRVRLFDEM
jgi:hypothetical protein